MSDEFAKMMKLFDEVPEEYVVTRQALGTIASLNFDIQEAIAEGEQRPGIVVRDLLVAAIAPLYGSIMGLEGRLIELERRAARDDRE